MQGTESFKTTKSVELQQHGDGGKFVDRHHTQGAKGYVK
jgi:hypothetical protein